MFLHEGERKRQIAGGWQKIPSVIASIVSVENKEEKKLFMAKSA